MAPDQAASSSSMQPHDLRRCNLGAGLRIHSHSSTIPLSGGVDGILPGEWMDATFLSEHILWSTVAFAGVSATTHPFQLGKHSRSTGDTVLQSCILRPYQILGPASTVFQNADALWQTASAPIRSNLGLA